MTSLQVDTPTFTFRASIKDAQIFDKWIHYTTVWNTSGRRKAVDVVAVEYPESAATTWMIEAKDFRVIMKHRRPCNIGGLVLRIADSANTGVPWHVLKLRKQNNETKGRNCSTTS